MFRRDMTRLVDRALWFICRESINRELRQLRRTNTRSRNEVNLPSTTPRSGELRMQKLKSHLVRTQTLNVLPL